MKLLSIDVGMKNLAFCLFDVTNSKNFLVTKWDVVDICQEKKYKCCYIEKGKECVADAKFFKDDKAQKHFPAEGQSTLSGIIVDANLTTGLANKVERFIYGGVLNN